MKTETMPDNYKDGDFAKGLADFFAKGIKGPNVRLTKARCRILMDIVRDHKYETAIKEELHGDKYADDWCAVMQWLSNQVYKRHSPAGLAD